MRNTVHHEGTTEGTKRPLASLNKALDALEAFTVEDPELSLGELSHRLRIAKPTLHRILQNLERRGYVRRDPVTRRYSLGLRTWEVGVAATGGANLRELVRPAMRGLSQATGEQVTLWVYDRGDAVCVDRVEGSHRVRSHTSLGTREQAHLLASGRSLLAFQDPGEIERVIQNLDGSARPDDLRERLARLRLLGYEVSRGDRWSDVYAVSAPLVDALGTARAAISVSGPSNRFDDAAVESISTLVSDAAGEVSRRLGYEKATTRSDREQVR